MKGVSSVIAIILILMIVIALAALAYTWFSGVFASLTATAAGAVSTTTQQMVTQFTIDMVRNTSTTAVTAYIRNIGTTDIDCLSIAASVSDIKYTATPSGCTSNKLTQYNTAAVAVSGLPSISCGVTTVRITIGGGLAQTQTVTCT